MDADASRVGDVYRVGVSDRNSSRAPECAGSRGSIRVRDRDLVASIELLDAYVKYLGGDAVVNYTKLVDLLVHEGLGVRGGGHYQHHGQHRHQHHYFPHRLPPLFFTTAYSHVQKHSPYSVRRVSLLYLLLLSGVSPNIRPRVLFRSCQMWGYQRISK